MYIISYASILLSGYARFRIDFSGVTAETRSRLSTKDLSAFGEGRKSELPQSPRFKLQPQTKRKKKSTYVFRPKSVINALDFVDEYSKNQRYQWIGLHQTSSLVIILE